MLPATIRHRNETSFFAHSKLKLQTHFFTIEITSSLDLSSGAVDAGTRRHVRESQDEYPRNLSNRRRAAEAEIRISSSGTGAGHAFTVATWRQVERGDRQAAVA